MYSAPVCVQPPIDLVACRHKVVLVELDAAIKKCDVSLCVLAWDLFGALQKPRLLRKDQEVSLIHLVFAKADCLLHLQVWTMCTADEWWGNFGGSTGTSGFCSAVEESTCMGSPLTGSRQSARMV